MSVLIKGMKMPNSCRECKLRDDMACCLPLDTPYEDRWVGKNEDKREPDCPLIELPDHGDLIERDELMMKMWEASAYAPNHCTWVNARVVFASDIENAPVVIPAERSEDETN